MHQIAVSQALTPTEEEEEEEGVLLPTATRDVFVTIITRDSIWATTITKGTSET